MWRTRANVATASATFCGRLSTTSRISMASRRGVAVQLVLRIHRNSMQTASGVAALATRCSFARESHETGGAFMAAVGSARNRTSGKEEWRLVAALAAAGSALTWSLSDSPVSPKSVACSAAGAGRQAEEGGEDVTAQVTAEPSRVENTIESSTVEPSIARQHSPVALSLASEYNANGPIEDRHDVRQSPRGDFFASVYDGHGGWQCAEFARKRLNIVAQAELNNSLAKSTEQVKGALTHAFLRVEREYLYQVKAAFELGFGAVARTGSCALMALVRDQKLFVANAGDCRAVLGRRRKSSSLVAGWSGGGGGGVMEAVALSNDHNAREKVEQDKLRRLHPCEEDIVKCRRASACYVKGRLQPTRSLGDAYLKYSEFNGQAGMHCSGGRFLPPPYTPPYITAEPEIYVHNIDTTQDEFVVLASDGLWDYVSSAEAVEIVQTAAYRDGKPFSAGERLIEVVLERAAARYNLSVEGLKGMREGPSRRAKHDDITCVVFFFKGNERNQGFGAAEPEIAENNASTSLPVPQ